MTKIASPSRTPVSDAGPSADGRRTNRYSAQAAATVLIVIITPMAVKTIPSNGESMLKCDLTPRADCMVMSASSPAIIQNTVQEIRRTARSLSRR